MQVPAHGRDATGSGAYVLIQAPPAEDPNRYGGYRLLGKLGEGGMGVVYLAEQESLGRLDCRWTA